MYTIGEFSVITKLTVKTLRFYHEEGLLVPDYIDDETSFRYYNDSSVKKAETIAFLRSLDLGIRDIAAILDDAHEDGDLSSVLAQQKEVLEQRIGKYAEALERIETVMNTSRKYEMNIANGVVLEKNLDDMLFAGVRYRGRYEDLGNAFREVGRKAGRFISGPAMSMDYNLEYMENDADIEGGFPLSKNIKAEGIDIRVIRGGKAVTITHYGPYSTLGNTYQRLFTHIEENKYAMISPCREIYHKGPGMIFRGNPAKYLTEIQILVRS
ncbi:MAG: MerR family transcriptional regulator [Spirochaetota bacterium]